MLLTSYIDMDQRRPKVLRDNITSLTNGAIQRMAKVAFQDKLSAQTYEGRLSSLIYEEIRGITKIYLENRIRDTTTYVEHGRGKRTTTEHVLSSFERNGTPLALEAGRHTIKNMRHKDPDYNVGRDGQSRPRIVKTKENLATNCSRKTTIRTSSSASCVYFSKAGFERLVREVGQEFKTGLQFSAEALSYLQLGTENYLLDLLSDSWLVMHAAKRHTLMPKDIQLARLLRNEKR